LNKQERREVNVTADFVGFEIANEFVVGYGLDYANDYRMLPEIWTLQEAN
jgi:hypoxanthine phosphoribosyltransferase